MKDVCNGAQKMRLPSIGDKCHKKRKKMRPPLTFHAVGKNKREMWLWFCIAWDLVGLPWVLIFTRRFFVSNSSPKPLVSVLLPWIWDVSWCVKVFCCVHGGCGRDSHSLWASLEQLDSVKSHRPLNCLHFFLDGSANDSAWSGLTRSPHRRLHRVHLVSVNRMKLNYVHNLT